MARSLTSPRIVSRASFILFVVAMLTMLSELTWWTWLNLRTSAKERQNHLAQLARDADIAEHMINALIARDAAFGLGEEAAREREVARVLPLFPGVTFEHGHAALRVDAAVDLETQFASHVRMFVAEGAVFAVVLLFGAWLLFRAMRQELAIVRQSQNFLSAVTHELKSPLASLRLWVDTLERRPPAPDAWQRPLSILRSDIDRLDTLIGNVLLAARIEAHAEGATRAVEFSHALDVAAPLTAVVEQMTPQAVERGIAFRLRVEANARGPRVVIERPAFELLARNLIDNAIKYSGDAKSIDIELRATPTSMVLSVTDFGIGLAASEQGQIFEKFYRVGDEMVRQSAGTGLGLFLVRAVAEEHGGRVHVQSDGIQCGSRFVVSLPLAQALPSPTERSQQRGEA